MAAPVSRSGGGRARQMRSTGVGVVPAIARGSGPLASTRRRCRGSRRVAAGLRGPGTIPPEPGTTGGPASGPARRPLIGRVSHRVHSATSGWTLGGRTSAVLNRFVGAAGAEPERRSARVGLEGSHRTGVVKFHRTSGWSPRNAVESKPSTLSALTTGVFPEASAPSRFMKAAICSRVTNALGQYLPPPQPLVTPASAMAAMSA